MHVSVCDSVWVYLCVCVCCSLVRRYDEMADKLSAHPEDTEALVNLQRYLNTVSYHNLYSPKNTVAAISKQRQQIGRDTCYISIAWISTTVVCRWLSETVREITVPVWNIRSWLSKVNNGICKSPVSKSYLRSNFLTCCDRTTLGIWIDHSLFTQYCYFYWIAVLVYQLNIGFVFSIQHGFPSWCSMLWSVCHDLLLACCQMNWQEFLSSSFTVFIVFMWTIFGNIFRKSLSVYFSTSLKEGRFKWSFVSRGA